MIVSNTVLLPWQKKNTEPKICFPSAYGLLHRTKQYFHIGSHDFWMQNQKLLPCWLKSIGACEYYIFCINGNRSAFCKIPQCHFRLVNTLSNRSRSREMLVLNGITCHRCKPSFTLINSFLFVSAAQNWLANMMKAI